MDGFFPAPSSIQPPSSSTPATQLIPYQVLSDSDTDCSSDFSDQEELAAVPFTSKWNTPPVKGLLTRDTQDSKANELVPSASSKDEINLSPTATAGGATSGESRARIQKYAIKWDDIPQEMNTFLKELRRYFVKPVNLERNTAPISESTFAKAKERLLCKY